MQIHYTNLGAVFDALSTGPEHVVKLTIFVADQDMLRLGVLTLNATSMFRAVLPAQTLLLVPKLAANGNWAACYQSALSEKS